MHGQSHSSINHQEALKLRGNPASDWVCVGMLPLFGQDPFVEALPLYSRLLLIGVVLCVVAIIVLAVPPLFDYIRHWQERRRVESLMRRDSDKAESPKSPQDAGGHVENKPAALMPNALGWANDASAGEEPKARNAKSKSIPVQGKNILIADDDPVVMLALSQRLQHLGYNVMRSPDAMHALLGAVKIRPDLIILDVNMPSGNGLAVCEMMASDPRCAGIPVIIHSVISDEATKQRARQLGAYYVEKSTRSWAEIRSLVEKLLEPSQEKDVQKPLTAKPSVPKQKSSPSPIVFQPAEGKVDEKTVLEESLPEAQRIPEEETPPAIPHHQDLDLVETEEAAEEEQEVEEEAETPATEPAATTAVEEQAPEPPTVCGRPRVLCIESPANRMTSIEHQLEGLGLDVIRVSDLQEGFWSCFTENPQVVIVQCGESKERLWELLDRMSQHPVTRKLPILVINENQFLHASHLPKNTNVQILNHPFEWEELLSAIEKRLGVFHKDAEDRSAIARGFNPVEKQDDETRSEAPTTAQSSLRILCIDDDPVVSRAIALRMKPYGIEVLSAENGTQGYMVASAKHPDLVLLDMQMPSGDGHYVLSKLKENERTQDIPIIILTVETHPGVRRQMLSVGAEAFICKPVRWRKLFAEMSRNIELPDQLIQDYHLAGDLATS